MDYPVYVSFVLLQRACWVTMRTKKIQVGPTHKKYENTHIDVTSKIFIITLLLLGVDRTGVFKFRRFVSLIFSAYCIIIVCSTLYFIINLRSQPQDVHTIVMYSIVSQYIFCCIFDLFACKGMRTYYSMLDKFDLEIGCRPKQSFKATRKVIETIVTLLLLIALYCASNVLDVIIVTLPLEILCVHGVQIIELFYISHLLDLILLRIRWINYYLESSLNLSCKQHVQEYVHFDNNTKKDQVSMKKLMELYQIIVGAFETYNNTVKWQVLVILTFSFIGTLTFSFQVALIIINGTRNIVGALVNIGLLVVLLANMFAPCNSCDAVHKEALRLRELLATKLYDNKLDKSSRSVARALLALTETRDLTFSLMNMFTVDQSLPFTFTALLITYLIILLQFNKVLNN